MPSGVRGLSIPVVVLFFIQRHFPSPFIVSIHVNKLRMSIYKQNGREAQRVSNITKGNNFDPKPVYFINISPKKKKKKTTEMISH